MTLVSWNPIREFDDLLGQYNRLFGSLLPGERPGTATAEWRPMTNISETDKEYVIKAELPEVDKKDVEVTVHDGVINIRGERKLEEADENEKQHRIEFSYGAFSRSFTLPPDVDESGIHAESKNGVLKVHLPKTEARLPKPIPIKIK